ncbi:voltage-dependent calcium channel beta subunit-associated regulatory protein-like isoform X2 [Xyrauchen texanus]|uniref:voltage-dependent calcium channel beta subunit-associated regulatory protein-like isoform X2 n=1 Tax=Xyrauchen texanus TaxID=154827 RepID=UPI0022422106|nr:voltage-dependent calcium channel beta subunit-associated regulatory protein-like isoform X2 [Xyrauchen texanus]
MSVHIVFFSFRRHTQTYSMSDESPAQTRLTTDVPLASGAQEEYVLLLVVLCVFAGGTLIVLSLLLVFCHRCCRGGRRYSRSSDDLEKTNTTYVEEIQPTQDLTITTSCHGDTDTEHFLSATCTGRRVSFNESIVYEQSAKEQEKGRRYTLTEGDFHHLKSARLTHLHIPTPALNILTIMECDSPENSVSVTEQPSHTPALAIFQPGEGPSPDSPVSWNCQSPVCTLPGDSLNSTLNTSGTNVNTEYATKPPRSQTVELMSSCGLMEKDSGSGPALTHGTMFHLLSKLRRHASLEGAAPFFAVKKWKFGTIQRAASLEIKGAPRRRAFQRQRAASETLDQGVGDFLLHKPPVQPPPDALRRLSASSLDAGSPAPLSRLEVQAVMELNCNVRGTTTDVALMFPSSRRPLEMDNSEEDGQEMIAGASGGGTEGFGLACRQESLEQPSLYRDIWSLRASLEQYASSDLSSNDRDSVDADSVCSVGPSRMGVPSNQSQDIDDEMDGDGELAYTDVVRDAGVRRNGKYSVDAERGSDGETGNRKLLQMDSGYASIEAPCKAPEEFRLFGSASGKTASERRHFFTNAGRKGTVCESFEARLFKEELEDEVSESGVTVETENPIRVTPELTPATKPKLRFRRRDYSIDEKTEALFNEFLRHDPQLDQQGSPSLHHRHRSRIHLRKQWQRTKQHSDPGAARYSPSLERQRCYPLRKGDSANYPLDTRCHSILSRIASAADEEASEGSVGTESPMPDKPEELEGAGPPSETGSSGPELEENFNNSSNNTSCQFSSSHLQDNNARDCGILNDIQTDTQKQSQTDCGGTLTTFSTQLHSNTDALMPGNIHHTGTGQVDYSHHTLTGISPSDKLASTLDDQIYSSLRTQRGSQECVVTVSRTSPDLEQE